MDIFEQDEIQIVFYLLSDYMDILIETHLEDDFPAFLEKIWEISIKGL